MGPSTQDKDGCFKNSGHSPRVAMETMGRNICYFFIGVKISSAKRKALGSVQIFFFFCSFGKDFGESNLRTPLEN